MDTMEEALCDSSVDVNMISSNSTNVPADSNPEEVGDEKNGNKNVSHTEEKLEKTHEESATGAQPSSNPNKDKTDRQIENLEKTDEESATGGQSSSIPNKDQTDKAEKLVRLPVGRIKHLMKMDPDVSLATQEAVVLIAKGTELFIEKLVKEASDFTIKGKRKIIQRKDIDAVIEAVDPLAFLEGVLDDLC